MRILANIEKLLGRLAPWSLSLIAILAAVWMSHKPVMVRIGYVVSDQISRGLGVVPSHRVLLVRLDQTFPKSQFEELLANAIPTLLDDYRSDIVGVDMDFFSGNAKYQNLAAALAAAAKSNPRVADSVIWAVPPERSAQPAAQGQTMKLADIFCADCSDAEHPCRARLNPQPVFGTNDDPQNYALAIGVPDEDDRNRWSPRFVCQRNTQARLNTFHFAIVDIYCRRHPDALLACRDFQPNRQSRSRMYAWYHAENIDLCRLVNCHGQTLGRTDGLPEAAKSEFQGKLANNIVILYWDEPGNDEHMTMLGTEKGAAIVASLIENELQVGAQPHFWVLVLKYSMEALITVLLVFLFHYKYTKSLAILIAFGLFVLYLRLAPLLSSWVPDFRDYVFVLILAFWLEVLLKSAVHDVTAAIRSRKSGAAQNLPLQQPAPGSDQP
jgi:hypothetical protein